MIQIDKKMVEGSMRLFKLNMSQLSTRAGISYPTIHRIVKGEAEAITFPVLASLCDALKLTPGEIFSYKRR